MLLFERPADYVCADCTRWWPAPDDFRRRRLALFESCRPLALWLAGKAARRWPGLEDDDLRQVALLALWGATLTYDPDRGPFRAMVLRWVRGKLLNHFHAARHWRVLRHQHRSPGGPAALAGVVDRRTGPAELLERTEARRSDGERLRRLVRVLPPLQRAAVRSFLAGELVREAAARRNVTRQAEDFHRRRAFAALRSAWDAVARRPALRPPRGRG
jgi:RNA polymerase sigma factor (sigma-70 family)